LRVELRIGDVKSGEHGQQQERRNDRACEHDQEMPQRSRLAERRYRSNPQDDPGDDAKQADRDRQPG
jgi:hypothetical protein